MAVNTTIIQVQITRLHVVQPPAFLLGGEQHGKTAVLVDFDGLDRIHDDAELQIHAQCSRCRRIGVIVNDLRGEMQESLY